MAQERLAGGEVVGEEAVGESLEPAAVLRRYGIPETRGHGGKSREMGRGVRVRTRFSGRRSAGS